MIVILSDELNQSVFKVVSWLKYLGHECIRVNSQNFIRGLKITLGQNENLILQLDGLQIDFSDIDCFWYNRGTLNFKEIDIPKISSTEGEKNVVEFLNNEISLLREFIFRRLYQLPTLGRPGKANLNKLIVLDKAASIGLSIPQTIITTNKEELLGFYKEKNDVIFKPIGEYFLFSNNKKYFYSRTTKLSEKMIDDLTPEFFPNLIQLNVDALYEIRSFYLDGRIFSGALIKKKENEEIDIRESEFGVNAYELPDEVQEKITLLFKSINHNIGSFDMIRSRNGEYYFLEINPVGQYDFLSEGLNLGLDKLIAEKLIEFKLNGKAGCRGEE